MIYMGKLDAINKTIDTLVAGFVPNEKNVELVIDYFVPQITPESLEMSLKTYAMYLKSRDPKYVKFFDPMYALFSNYNQYLDGKMENIIRTMGRRWWKYLGPRLKDPSDIIARITEKKPEIKPMLASNLGKLYMQYYTQRLYDFFEIWLWRFPRWHNNCGGLIRYGLINKDTNVWGFYCRKCNVLIPSEQLEELTYTKKKS